MTYRLALGLAALAATAVQASEPPPIADFVRHSTYSSALISPTGEYLAATVPLGDRTGLVVMRRANNEVTAQFALGKDTHIDDFTWVSDDRLLLGMAEAFGSDDEPSATGEMGAPLTMIMMSSSWAGTVIICEVAPSTAPA